MSGLILRDGIAADVPEMSAFLERLRDLGIRQSPADPDFVMAHYIAADDRIKLTVAEREGQVIGFQSLKRAVPGNIYDVTPGWGVIGTHLNPDVRRQGIGRALFGESLAAARAAGLAHIDASIGDDNLNGQGYYAAMGFQTYRTAHGLVCKRYDVT